MELETSSPVDISLQVPTAQEIEGVQLDGPTIQGLFEQYVLTLWLWQLVMTTSNKLNVFEALSVTTCATFQF